MSLLLAALLLPVLALVAIQNVAARTIDLHVAPNGDDANPGTEDAPLATIAQAARMVKPGTTVHVAPGIYEGGFVSRESGTAKRPIRFVSTDRWGAKIVPPPRSASTKGWDNRGAHVEIDGFEVDGGAHRDGTRWRFGLYTAGSHSVIRNSKVHSIANHLDDPKADNGGAGILGDGHFGATDITLAENLIYDIGPRNEESSLIHGIYISTTGSVRNNMVFMTAGAGIHLWHDARAVHIAGNHVTSNNFGILVGGGDYIKTKGPNDDTLAEGNIVFGNRKCGIAEQGDTGENNRYINNVVLSNGSDWCLQTGLLISPSSAPNHNR